MPRDRRIDDGPPLVPTDEYGRTEQSLPVGALSVPWLIEPKTRFASNPRGHAGLLYAYASPSAFSERLPALSAADFRKADRMRELGLPVSKYPAPSLLDDFVALRDASEEQVLTFARKWGVLDLCKHKMPFCHDVGPFKWGIPRSWNCGPFKLPDRRFPRGWHY